MRRVGLIVLLAVLAGAAPAHAGEVNLWACHGPDGAPLGDAPFVTTVFSGDSEIVHGCAAAGDTMHAHFIRPDPQGAAAASMRLDAPAGLAVTELRLRRTAKGPGYSVAGANGVSFESEDAGATLSADLDVVTNSTFVRIGVACGASLGQRCASDDAYADVRAVEFTAIDAGAPVFTVGGFHSPAAGVMDLTVQASDTGAGLASASAALDGTTVAATGFPSCAELSPGDASHDLALGALCPAAGTRMLSVDTASMPDGDHQLAVKVLDAAGNVRELDFTVIVQNGVATPSPTATPVTLAATPTPTPATTGPPPVPAPLTTAGAVALPKRLVAATGSISLTVSCPRTAKGRCTLRLTAGGRRLATSSGSVAPGSRARITLKLTAAARRTLLRRGVLKATLTLYEGATGRPGVSVTLRTR